MIPSDSILQRENLVRIRVVCSERVRGLVAGECLPIQSSVRYRCSPGFRLENNDPNFDAACLRNGEWERRPRCVRVTSKDN